MHQLTAIYVASCMHKYSAGHLLGVKLNYQKEGIDVSNECCGAMNQKRRMRLEQ